MSRGNSSLDRIGLTERLDRWAAHPFWGLLILVGILGLVLWFTFTVGTPLQDLLATCVVGALLTDYLRCLSYYLTYKHMVQTFSSELRQTLKVCQTFRVFILRETECFLVGCK